MEFGSLPLKRKERRGEALPLAPWWDATTLTLAPSLLLRTGVKAGGSHLLLSPPHLALHCPQRVAPHQILLPLPRSLNSCLDSTGKHFALAQRCYPAPHPPGMAPPPTPSFLGPGGCSRGHPHVPTHTQTPLQDGASSGFGLPPGPLLLVLWFSGLTPLSPASRDSPLR